MIKIDKMTDNINLYDTLLEQSLLGSVFIDISIYFQIEHLSTDIFYYEHHKIIFENLKEVYKEKGTVDLLLLLEHMKSKGILESVGGASYLTSLSTVVTTTSNIHHYIDVLEELAYKREVVKSCYKLINNIREGEDINTSLNLFEQITKIDSDIKTDNTLKSIMQSIFDDLNNGEPVNKLTTGISIIDKCTNGIANGELVTIGAHSGVGKSALAINIAINSYLKGKRVLIVSREMTKEQVAERVILSNTGMSKKKYESRDFNDNDWESIIKTMEKFSTEEVKIDDKISTLQEIKRELREFKPDILVVDYVQLLTPSNSKEMRERQVAELSRELKKITSDYGIIVIQLTQLAEKGMGNYRPHGESYTRESRAIYHDSNIVIYIHNVTEEKELEQAFNKTVFKERGSLEDMKTTLDSYKERGIKFIELIVDKNRSGEVGSKYYWFKGSDLSYHPVS